MSVRFCAEAPTSYVIVNGFSVYCPGHIGVNLWHTGDSRERNYNRRPGEFYSHQARCDILSGQCRKDRQVVKSDHLRPLDIQDHFTLWKVHHVAEISWKTFHFCKVIEFTFISMNHSTVNERNRMKSLGSKYIEPSEVIGIYGRKVISYMNQNRTNTNQIVVDMFTASQGKSNDMPWKQFPISSNGANEARVLWNEIDHLYTCLRNIHKPFYCPLIVFRDSDGFLLSAFGKVRISDNTWHDKRIEGFWYPHNAFGKVLPRNDFTN
jgi:hypothetical protein